MKYASSIVRGGELVDASECDYDSYKKLGLLCPECKDPVFLKSEGMRFQGEKEVKIGAHFSHFANKNPEQAKVCEKRVSGYTQSDINRAIAKGRGQRLKLLQRWFWDMFTHAHFSAHEFKKELFLKRLDALLFNFNQSFSMFRLPENFDCLSLSEIEKQTSDLPSVVTENDGNKYFCFGCTTLADIAKAVQEEKWIEAHLYEYYSIKESWSPIDKDFHLRVCLEVSNFLSSKKNLHLVQLLTGAGLLRIIHDRPSTEWFIEQVANEYSLDNLFGLEIAKQIWDVNWVEEFARLSAEPKAIAS